MYIDDRSVYWSPLELIQLFTSRWTSHFYRVGPAPGGIFVTFSRYFYVQLHMYILSRLVPETSYWRAFEIILSSYLLVTSSTEITVCHESDQSCHE
jgi:hypothetical protein